MEAIDYFAVSMGMIGLAIVLYYILSKIMKFALFCFIALMVIMPIAMHYYHNEIAMLCQSGVIWVMNCFITT